MGGAMPTLLHAPSLRGQGQLSFLVYTMNWVWRFGEGQPVRAATAKHTTPSQFAAQHYVKHLQTTDRHFSILMLLVTFLGCARLPLSQKQHVDECGALVEWC